MKFRTRANQGGESVHRSKSAPARPAEFISNLLTLLRAQIETSSSAHAPEVQSVRSDSMIYRRSHAADAAERGLGLGGGGEGGAGAVRRFHQTGNPVTLERDCSVSVEVTEKHLQDSRRVMRASLEERWGQM